MINTAQYIKNFSDWRNERAKAILEKGNPETLDEFTLEPILIGRILTIM